MSEQNARPRHRMHGPGGGMMPGEKAKDFRGTTGRLFRYMGAYRYGLAAVMLFAIGGTTFNIVGPKILSKATTELFNGLIDRKSVV